MAERLYNFSAGPAMMPEPVLEQFAHDMVDYEGGGIGVAELSHRGDQFQAIAAEAETDLRDLLDVPDDYAVLFLQGGATGQFTAVPQNLTERSDTADYIITGSWSKKAVKEGKKVLDGLFIGAETAEYRYVHQPLLRDQSEDPKYLHITPNETIEGVAYSSLPNTRLHWREGDAPLPLVADVSSTILSEPLDVSQFGVLYAGAQKNIGPAGLTVVVVDKELLGRARPETPAVWNWTEQAEAGSMINTPPTAAWHMAGLVFKWLKQQGGLEAVAEVNGRKASKLYAAIDESILFSNPVVPRNRSRMNVPIIMTRAGLDARFLEDAAHEGLVNLEGHRSVGGMRASIYNAMPEEGVNKLVDFMRQFEEANS